MTPIEAFDAGDLSEAIALQEPLAASDPAERLALVQLLMFAGQLADARTHLALIDADDRFASVLEVFIGGEYVWLPWEGLRSVRLDPVHHLRDQLFRPAEVRLADGTAFPAHVPLIYPRSYQCDGVFACGFETDF